MFLSVDSLLGGGRLLRGSYGIEGGGGSFLRSGGGVGGGALFVRVQFLLILFVYSRFQSGMVILRSVVVGI